MHAALNDRVLNSDIFRNAGFYILLRADFRQLLWRCSRHAANKENAFPKIAGSKEKCQHSGVAINAVV